MIQPFTDAEYVRDDYQTLIEGTSETLIGQFDGFEVSEACSARCGATFTASGPDGDRIAALVAAWRTDHRHLLI